MTFRVSRRAGSEAHRGRLRDETSGPPVSSQSRQSSSLGRALIDVRMAAGRVALRAIQPAASPSDQERDVTAASVEAYS